MRRVNAKQAPPREGTLRHGVCCVCGARGIQVLAWERAEKGVSERLYCSIDPCARAEGWPWVGQSKERAL